MLIQLEGGLEVGVVECWRERDTNCDAPLRAMSCCGRSDQ